MIVSFFDVLIFTAISSFMFNFFFSFWNITASIHSSFSTSIFVFASGYNVNFFFELPSHIVRFLYYYCSPLLLLVQPPYYYFCTPVTPILLLLCPINPIIIIIVPLPYYCQVGQDYIVTSWNPIYRKELFSFESSKNCSFMSCKGGCPLEEVDFEGVDLSFLQFVSWFHNIHQQLGVFIIDAADP